MAARKERVDYVQHLADLKAARDDYKKASTSEARRAASERSDAARKACETSRAEWNALPQEEYRIALDEGLTPAEVLGRKAEIGAKSDLWRRVITGVGFIGGKMTSTIALAASRAGRRAERHAAWLASPASKVAGATTEIEGRVQLHAQAALGWRRSARAETDAVTKAKYLRASLAEERRFLRERATLPVTSHLACMAMSAFDDPPTAPTRPSGTPLPDDIAPVATAHAGLSAALQAAVDALLAGSLSPKLANDVDTMLEGYIEAAGLQRPDIDTEAMVGPISDAVEGGDPNAAMEAIAAIADATGASVRIPDGPISTPATRLQAASVRPRAARPAPGHGHGVAYGRGVRVG